MKLNEQSVKKLDEVVAKNYYFRIDEENRLTLELTDTKTIEECVSITADTINKIKSVQ